MKVSSSLLLLRVERNLYTRFKYWNLYRIIPLPDLCFLKKYQIRDRKDRRFWFLWRFVGDSFGLYHGMPHITWWSRHRIVLDAVPLPYLWGIVSTRRCCNSLCLFQVWSCHKHEVPQPLNGAWFHNLHVHVHLHTHTSAEGKISLKPAGYDNLALGNWLPVLYARSKLHIIQDRLDTFTKKKHSLQPSRTETKGWKNTRMPVTDNYLTCLLSGSMKLNVGYYQGP